MDPVHVIGGGLAGFGGAFGGHAALAGAIAGGLKFKEAQTSMLLADARSGVQVSAAEGSTRKADLSLGGALFDHALQSFALVPLHELEQFGGLDGQGDG